MVGYEVLKRWSRISVCLVACLLLLSCVSTEGCAEPWNYHLSMENGVNSIRESLKEAISPYKEFTEAGNRMSDLELRTYVNYVDMMAALSNAFWYESALASGGAEEATERAEVMIKITNASLSQCHDLIDQYDSGEMDYSTMMELFNLNVDVIFG